MTRAGSRPANDDGTATVEFVLVGLMLLVPLTYVLLTALAVQSRAYAVVEAARSGARAYVTAPNGSAARLRAQEAVRLSLADQSLPSGDATMTVACSRTPCLTPGGTVRVQVSATVGLGWVPDWLGEGRAAIPVTAVHVETVDPFEPARP